MITQKRQLFWFEVWSPEWRFGFLRPFFCGPFVMFWITVLLYRLLQSFSRLADILSLSWRSFDTLGLAAVLFLWQM